MAFDPARQLYHLLRNPKAWEQVSAGMRVSGAGGLVTLAVCGLARL